MSGDGLRVVVVEDDPTMRLLLKSELVANGFQVHGCSDAASLWRYLERHACDLVLLDIGLPDEDGFSICRRLQNKSELAVVMLSGYGGAKNQTRGVAEGADAYLVKPVDSPVLVATLRKAAQRRPGLPGTARHGITVSPGWMLLEQGWVLYAPDDKSIPLNAHERNLLRLMVAADGMPVAVETLRAALVDNGTSSGFLSLDQVLRRLHDKIAILSGCRLPLHFNSSAGRFQIAPFAGPPPSL